MVQSGRGDWRVLSVTRGDGRAKPPCGTLLSLRNPELAVALAAAHRVLDVAAGLRVEALGRAIPLFEKSSRTLHDKGYLDQDDFLGTFAPGDLADADTAFVWESIPLAEILALDPDPKAYATHLWGAVHELAVIDVVGKKTKKAARA